MVPPLLYPVRTSEHLAGIYIVCLEAERNIEPPEEVQHDSQGYEQGTGVGQHHTAQGTDAGIFVIFLAINDNQGIESEHRCADVDGGVTDTECGLGQFRGNADVMSRLRRATKTMTPKMVICGGRARDFRNSAPDTAMRAPRLEAPKAYMNWAAKK
mgnify:CR=1 FL=1